MKIYEKLFSKPNFNKKKIKKRVKNRTLLFICVKN